MSNSAPLKQLGEFIVKFQLVESLLTQLIEDIVQPDPEYVRALAAELEFTAKSRALNVIFARFAQIHGLSEKAPHPAFHKLMTKVVKLAERRNELVHSFYGVILTQDEGVGLLRTPTRLKPSQGKLREEDEALLEEHLSYDTKTADAILSELWAFRQQVIDALYPAE